MGKQRRHSIFWALILIVIGALLLLNTMDILPGNFMELLLKLWPVLFIVGGLDNIIQGRGWVWAVISLGLGTVFLLANFGHLPWNSLSILLRMWPLILVAIGLDLIFEGRGAGTTIIGVFIALLIVAGVAWFVLGNSPTAKLANQPVTQALQGATSAEIRISDPVGRLELSSGAGSDVLVEGAADLLGKMKLNQDYTVQSKHGNLTMTPSGGNQVAWDGIWGEPLWAFELNKDIPLTLDAEAVAGSLALDLTGLDLEALHATVAVGSLDLTLDRQDTFKGTLENPVGKITIHVPAGALVEFNMDTVISTYNLPADYKKVGRMVYSPNATAANATVRLTVSQPIGLVSLQPVK